MMDHSSSQLAYIRQEYQKISFFKKFWTELIPLVKILILIIFLNKWILVTPFILTKQSNFFKKEGRNGYAEPFKHSLCDSKQ